MRWLAALASVYLGATMFGVAAGTAAWAGRAAGVAPGQVFLEGLATALYGTTLLLVGLWPLAYFTHFLVESGSDILPRP